MVSQVEEELRRKLHILEGELFSDKESDIDTYVTYNGDTEKYDLTEGKSYKIYAVQKYSREKCFIMIFNDSKKFCKYNSELFTTITIDEDSPKSFIQNILGITKDHDKCQLCGEIRSPELLKLIHGQKICAKCLANETIFKKHTCSICKDMDFSKPLKNLDGLLMCDNCFVKESARMTDCPICREKFVSKATSFELEGRGKICTRCTTNNRYKQYTDLFPKNDERYFRIGLSETTFNNISDRTFGVEFEIESREYLRQSIRSLTKELTGIMVDSKHTLLDYIRAHHDGSIHKDFGVELVTTVLRGDKGLRVLEQLTNSMNKYFTTSEKCGLHIHIGVDDFDEKELIDLYYVYQTIQPILKYYISPSRLKNKYCARIKKLGKNIFEEVKKKVEVESFDKEKVYKDKSIKDIHNAQHWDGINFSAVPEHGTIEIRMMEGNLDYNRISEWINLHMKIIDWVKANNDNNLYNKKLNIEEILGSELFEEMLEKKRKYRKDNDDNDDEDN